MSRPGLIAEFRDAVAPRTVALVVGVLVIQVLFIAAYVDAFHKPTPHQVPLTVVAPAHQIEPIVDRLNSLAGHPVRARAVTDETVAASDVRAGKDAGAIDFSASGSTDTVFVASGGGAALAGTVENIATAVATAQHRTTVVDDLVPLQAGDYRGLTGFYLVVGWIVGGYLVAAILGIASGARPANTRRAILRLLTMAIYAIASGFLGALVVDQGLGALRGHYLALAGVGILVVYAAGAATLAFQVLAGVIGIGITVLVFVVAGNPSAGGAYQPALLPAFFRAISGALPNGAGVETVRRIVYFSSDGITTPLLAISAWIVAGVAVAVLGSLRYGRRPPATPA